MYSLSIYIGVTINRDAAIFVRQYYDELVETETEGIVNKIIEKLTQASIFISIPFAEASTSAIEIGRSVRAKHFNVLVSTGAQCGSACHFILAGEVTRHVDGRLGMRRPFLETPSRSMATEDVKKIAIQNQERLRAYFREMNISERLDDDMMMIPSTQMRWLWAQEISVYELGVNDPVIEETKALRAAQKYGLSRIEYERRRQRARTLCSTLSPPDCWDKIMRAVRPQR